MGMENSTTGLSNRYSMMPGQLHNKPDEYEYILVVQPGKELGKQILDTRSGFEETYHQVHPGRINHPYIKLASFRAKEAMESTIERWIQRICAGQECFPVMLNNFSGFPTGKLFVRVQYHEPFLKLASGLSVIDDYIKSYGCPSAKIVSHPHVTIANRLPADMYTKAMLDYSQRDFSGSFMVEEVLLLKRKNHSEEFKKINLFKLMPGLASVTEAV
jgi:2'-5' RNA ligase